MAEQLSVFLIKQTRQTSELNTCELMRNEREKEAHRETKTETERDREDLEVADSSIFKQSKLTEQRLEVMKFDRDREPPRSQ